MQQKVHSTLLLFQLGWSMTLFQPGWSLEDISISSECIATTIGEESSGGIDSDSDSDSTIGKYRLLLYVVSRFLGI